MKVSKKFIEQSVMKNLISVLQRNLAKQPFLHHDVPFVRASVAAMFRWKEKEKQSLQLLFVRRCVNEKDTWSGQVAFPGGRRQKKIKTDDSSLNKVSKEWTDWESLCETAQRETMEEVGLDLSTSYVSLMTYNVELYKAELIVWEWCVRHVHWIGNLPPIRTHLRSLSVSIQAASEHDYKPKLQRSEVADVLWVDVHELFNTQRYHVLSYPLEDSLMSLRMHPRVLAMAKRLLGNMLFDCIYLPRPNHLLLGDDHLSRRNVHDFVLWGLTLRAVVDLFAVAGSPLPMRPNAQHFDSKILGKIVLYCMRFPEKVMAGTATISTMVLVGVISSRL
ncbi:hypothetical protein DD237_002133 [Peronospora effusa]|uniref:Nudix hydrolase domain-containing protein n=1 Tax=Peronospora effusa TaxID=542832 RepID=A0A425CKF7_9STRA|nr:hypothetical protein DD237_002133 [Peronospora effusa]